MKRIQYITLVAIGTITSCTQVIDIDYKDLSPQLVVNGKITDQPGPYTVHLSKTMHYTGSNNFPAVSGAQVTVNDGMGNTETLTETTPGDYCSSTLQGTSGRTYTLSITAEGKHYSGQSTMPIAIAIDSLFIEDAQGSLDGATNKNIVVYYKDPGGIQNYYRFLLFVNGIQKNNLYISEDRFTDGINVIERFEKDSLESGDAIQIVLQSIDKSVYDYLYALQQMDNNIDMFAPIPSNPKNNLSNHALGYFSACTVRVSQTIVVP